MALVTEKEGKLWLVDTASGAKQEVSGRSGGQCRRAGRAWRCRGPSRFRRQPAGLPELRRKGRGRQWRGARLRAAGNGQRSPADRGVQDHLAAGPQGVGQRPFRPSYRLRPRWPALSQLGRPAEIHPRAGHGRQSRQNPPAYRRGASGTGQSVGVAGRRRGAILVDRPPQPARPGLRPRRQIVGERDGSGRRRRGQPHHGGQELRLAQSLQWQQLWRRRHPRSQGRRRVSSRPRYIGPHRSLPAG